MLDLQTTETLFKQILGKPGNKHCIDCGSLCSWVSVNNGILICMECSGVHRSFGVRVSFVRSITMDSWSEEQVKSVQQGGNQNMKSFLESYGITDDNFPQQTRYKTRAAQFYRDRLQAAVKDEPFLVAPPSIEEGKILIELKNPNFQSSFQPITNTNYKEIDSNDKWENFKDKTKEVGGKAYNESKIIASKISEQTGKLYDKTKSTLSDPEFQQNIKDKMSSAKESTVKGFSAVGKSIGKFWNFTKEKVNNTVNKN